MTNDVHEFLDNTGEALRRERAHNTVLLTVAETVRRSGWPAERGPVLFGWQNAGRGRSWRDVDPHAIAFLRTPPFPALFTAMPALAATDLARELAERKEALAGVNAEASSADVFVREWQHRTGATGEVHKELRLFRLGTLSVPDPVPDGGSRVAAEDDAGLLVDWLDRFAAEVHEPAGPDNVRTVNDRLSYRGITLWETPDGEPVSMAVLTRRIAGMVRVGPVYTPPRHRARGYAGAVTAEVSRQARRSGADEVLLFTDQANPTSNALYQRIGYQPVADRVLIRFKLP